MYMLLFAVVIVLQMMGIILLYAMYRELRVQGLASKEAWKTIMAMAIAMQTAVDSHEHRIRSLETDRNARDKRQVS